MGEIRFERDT